ncbi:MAG: hypothetical protein Q8W44_05485 [Candidatus Palauibacterales bacterium]|nr:hypothetical protein [Candidatus Palauibacterales bacterium]
MARRNVTITLDEETAEWARIEAARRDTSMSRLVGSLLHEHMLRERNYESAKREFLSSEPKRLKRSGGYPDRDEVHSRDGR